jgi:hypothetical protein
MLILFKIKINLRIQGCKYTDRTTLQHFKMVN